NTATPEQHIELTATYSPDPSHIGQAADLFVVAQLNGVLFMRDQQGAFYPWDFNIATLVPAGRSSSLRQGQDLTIFNGALGLSGELLIFLGYRTSSGVFVYSPAPAYLQIN